MSGAPCAVAAVAPDAVAPTGAVCVGGGAGKAGAFAAGLAAAAADDDDDGGGGLQSSCLSCCPSRTALRCRKGSPGLGGRPAGRCWLKG
eukprot:1158323-Pelagomonas_calceolata.AAC.1